MAGVAQTVLGGVCRHACPDLLLFERVREQYSFGAETSACCGFLSGRAYGVGLGWSFSLVARVLSRGASMAREWVCGGGCPVAIRFIILDIIYSGHSPTT
eukprot:594205-Prymnesium_polylepis.1